MNSHIKAINLYSNFTSYDIADELLKYLHKELLTEYKEDQTRIDRLIETGTFNCLSSAIIYMFFAKVAQVASEWCCYKGSRVLHY